MNFCLTKIHFSAKKLLSKSFEMWYWIWFNYECWHVNSYHLLCVDWKRKIQNRIVNNIPLSYHKLCANLSVPQSIKIVHISHTQSLTFLKWLLSTANSSYSISNMLLLTVVCNCIYVIVVGNYWIYLLN